MRYQIPVATFVAISLVTSAAVAQQNEPCPGAQLVPTGVHDDPNELFESQHYETTAGMPLQGNLASIKYAPVMVPWNQINDPTDPSGNVADFQTAFVIDNPDGSLPLIVDVDFFNADGTLSATLNDLTIDPFGHLQREVSDSELAGPIGMMRVTVDEQSEVQEFVGATIYYASQIIDPFAAPGSGTTRIERPMSSMQPLQEYQHSLGSIQWFGPIPVRLLTGIDSLNGLIAFQNVCNPSNFDNNITVVIESPIAGTIATNYTIKPNGTLSLFDTWTYAVNTYPTLMQDHDIVVRVKSTSGIPVLGENIFLDLYGGNAGAPVSQGGSTGEGGSGGAFTEGVQQGDYLTRARMTSTMLAYTPKATLINPELTDTTYISGVAPVQGTMGICNVDVADAGPVVIEYYDNLGAAIGTDTIATLPQYTTAVIGPGLAQSPNFPINGAGTFKGSVRFTSCGGDIIGWANRASENNGSLPAIDAPKMWGELLHRAGGREHRIGWLDANNIRNKIAPLVLHDVGYQQDPLLTIPGYIAIANHRSSNTDAYAMRFYDPFGVATGFGVYLGLPARSSAFTYLEPLITQASPVGGGGFFGDMSHHMGLILNRTQSIEGIQTIGGRLHFYLRFVGEMPYYPGPGDTVPPQ